ncbi:hypothetical protein BO83DRAFT_448924 [Aspergillus eucalypticola CBS 122712]|uniref:Uncharacterized protein n=1 Tax=Aspergillus eucalypticola (strain CBS 122712 / IBT 29274) TaxID=1448314 RepID=A0A317V6Y9_ASPEC|nr:uncharacterized protein BO83DRAFT_448924 [Aspergillus eucalypticola CBS 122712]PWY68828.1 hypothetical protein BO83DRAFT_448924 [Aspergillus eucalypticola CBS 122712]
MAMNDSRSEYEDLSCANAAGLQPLMLASSMPKRVSQDTIVAVLEAAMRQIRSHVPGMAGMAGMAGKVINVGKGPGNPGRYAVASGPLPDLLIVVRDDLHAFPPCLEEHAGSRAGFIIESFWRGIAIARRLL